MTNRNEYLRHLDIHGEAMFPTKVKFSDNRSDAQRKAEASKAKLAAQIHASEREKELRRSRTGTLRGLWVRRGGDL